MSPMRRLGSLLALLLALLLACGGEDEGPDEVRIGDEPASSAPTLVAALGDSITAGTPLWDPAPAIRRRIGQVDPESQYAYWVQLRLKGTRFRNCGVPGERTDEIAARLERCAKGADVLIVQGGINDIAQARDVGAAAEDLRSMVKRGRELGLRVALVELLPWNNGYPAAAPAVRELNRLIGGIGRELEVPVYPWYEQLEDPRAPGRMKREWTSDGDHPSVAGYRRLARTVELP